MGVDTCPEAGWLRNKGLRIIGGGMRLELPWPELASFPDYGLVRTAQRLRRDPGPAGAEGRRPAARAAPTSPARARRPHRPHRRRAAPRPAPDKEPRSPTARRSWSPPTASPPGSPLALGLHKRDDRPMGVAVRRYYTSPRHDDDYLESWLELWDRASGRRPAAARLRLDLRRGRRHRATSASASSTPASAFENVDYRDLLQALARRARPRSGASARRTAPRRSAARRCRWASTAAALHPRAAAGRRRRRHGQPVQRRGHRLRDGVRRSSPPRSSCRRWPGRRRRSASARCRRYPPTLKDALRRLLHARPALREADRQPEVMQLATQHGLPHPR